MQIRQEQRQYDYERFEENRRFEEMTDIAERIGYPIDTTIQYEVRNGAVYARTDTVDRPFHNQTYMAWQRGQGLFTGDQAFEVERLRIEHQEALMVDAFGAGDLDGTVLIKVSKVPDAIVHNKTTIKGYRRDLQRSFVRIYYKDAEGVTCRLFTLDHNHELGMKRVGELLGIATNRPSEQVLADHSLLSVVYDTEAFVEDLVARTKEIYDSAIFEETGKQSVAGSTFTNRIDAMQAIANQPGLFKEHMDAIGAIMRHTGHTDSREDLLESQRERIAAAVSLASQGHSIASVGGADVAREVESGDYGRECATATGMNQSQTGQMENIWRQGECQVCFSRTTVGSCMVCAACAAADDRGEDLLKLRDQNLRTRRLRRAASNALWQSQQKTEQQKTVALHNHYGQKVRLQKIITIGGQDTLVIDKNDAVIDKL